MVDLCTTVSGPAATPDPTPIPPPVPPPVPILMPPPTIHLSNLVQFSGDSESCCSFLIQCGLHFEMQASSFPMDHTKVAYMISHLTGRAEAWATPELARDSPVHTSVDNFKDALSKICDQNTPDREAASVLMGLLQGKRMVADYTIEFRILGEDSGWNSFSLCNAYQHGLSDHLKHQLAPLELPEGLDSLISLSVRIDKRFFEREKERSKAEFTSSQRGSRLQFHLHGDLPLVLSRELGQQCPLQFRRSPCSWEGRDSTLTRDAAGCKMVNVSTVHALDTSLLRAR